MPFDYNRLVEAVTDAQFERIRGRVKQQYYWERKTENVIRLANVLRKLG
jgi:hypothetical protein